MPSSFSTFVTSLQKLPRRTLVTRTRRLARRSRKAMYVSTQMSFSIYVQFWLFKVLKKYKIWNWGFYLLLYNRCQSLSVSLKLVKSIFVLRSLLVVKVVLDKSNWLGELSLTIMTLLFRSVFISFMSFGQVSCSHGFAKSPESFGQWEHAARLSSWVSPWGSRQLVSYSYSLSNTKL